MDVNVDEDVARFGTKSYAIDTINSVEVREHQPDGRGAAILCGLVAMLALTAWLGSLSRAEGSATGGLIVAFVFSRFAWWRWPRARVRQYQLFLMTSSSEARAIISRDGDYLQNLRDRIETSMLRHSRFGTDR